MSPRTLGLSEVVSQYLMQVGLREPDVLRSVRQDTARLPGAHMQIAPEQGQLMALLAHLINARSCLEIGTFTGYSTLALALALPPEGCVVACEIDQTFAAIARKHWERAGVARELTSGLDLRSTLSTRCSTMERRDGSTWPSSMPIKKTSWPTTSGVSH